VNVNVNVFCNVVKYLKEMKMKMKEKLEFKGVNERYQHLNC